MQPQPWPEVPADTARVARKAFRKGGLAIRARDELGSWYDDEAFGAAYGARGKPGISPAQLAMVTVLQFAENLTDRQAADAVRGRLDWKYCLGLSLEDEGFDFSVLSEFRARLVAGDMDQKILDLLLDRLKRLGLVKAGGRQRTDSTHVLAAIRGMNRLELAGESVRAALEALAAAAPGWLAGVIDASWQQVYGQRIDNLRLPASETARAKLAEQYGRDGYHLLEAVHAPAAPGWLRELPAVQALRAVWVQQYYRVIDEHGEKVIRREAREHGLPPGRLKLVSPYDLDARYSEKRGKGWEGYKVHLSGLKRAAAGGQGPDFPVAQRLEDAGEQLAGRGGPGDVPGLFAAAGGDAVLELAGGLAAGWCWIASTMAHRRIGEPCLVMCPLIEQADLPGQPIDQLPQRGDLAGVRLGQVQPVQPRRPEGAEQVRAGHRAAELGQHRVHSGSAARTRTPTGSSGEYFPKGTEITGYMDIYGPSPIRLMTAPHPAYTGIP